MRNIRFHKKVHRRLTGPVTILVGAFAFSAGGAHAEDGDFGFGETQNPVASLQLEGESLAGMLKDGDIIEIELHVTIPESTYGYLPGSSFGIPIAVRPAGAPFPEFGTPDIIPADTGIRGRGFSLMVVEYPEGERKTYPELGDENIVDFVVHDTAVLTLQIRIDNRRMIRAAGITLHVMTQLCNGETGVCYSPETLPVRAIWARAVPQA